LFSAVPGVHALLAAEDTLATLGEYHREYHWCQLTDAAFEGVVEELLQTQRNGHVGGELKNLGNIILHLLDVV
jgi:hypothetical protein